MKRSFLTTPHRPLIRLWYGHLWFVGSDRSDCKYDAIKHILLNIRVTVFQPLQVIVFIPAVGDERIATFLQSYHKNRDSFSFFLFIYFRKNFRAIKAHECDNTSAVTYGCPCGRSHDWDRLGVIWTSCLLHLQLWESWTAARWRVLRFYTKLQSRHAVVIMVWTSSWLNRLFSFSNLLFFKRQKQI